MDLTIEPNIISIPNENFFAGKGQDRAEIITISRLLSTPDVRIPEYQRPYRWEAKHVTQLINDIFTHRNRKHYRLGTIVIHRNEIGGKIYNDLVDGQQRFTTLRIILEAIYRIHSPHLDSFHLQKLQLLKNVVDNVPLHYKHKITVRRISENFQLALQLINKYDTDAINAFLEKCEVVVFYISDITEAFQFFDSQNARGKDLYPHDLLKAYHLREFNVEELDRQNEIVKAWEGYPMDELSNIFAGYLYRIKGWAAKKNSRWFGKNDIAMFKGVNISKTGNYPYIMNLQIAHHFVDDYNARFDRCIDRHSMSFPFQLDSIMINGRRFFEYVSHYKNVVDSFRKDNESLQAVPSSENQTKYLFYLVYKNSKSHRDGEQYIKSLFECAMIYYIDKFGYSDFDAWVEKAFVWCYNLRFWYQRIAFESVDNYVLRLNMFALIRDSITPAEVLRATLQELPRFVDVENFSSSDQRMDHRIAKFFKTKMYYDIN